MNSWRSEMGRNRGERDWGRGEAEGQTQRGGDSREREEEGLGKRQGHRDRREGDTERDR